MFRLRPFSRAHGGNITIKFLAIWPHLSTKSCIFAFLSFLAGVFSSHQGKGDGDADAGSIFDGRVSSVLLEGTSGEGHDSDSDGM